MTGIISVLEVTRVTCTPAEVMFVAREACASVRERLGHGRLTGRLVPHSPTMLVAHLEDRSGHRVAVMFNVYMDYSIRALHAFAAKDMVHLPVPDVPEALHLAGIIFEDLAVEIVGIGQRCNELNRSLWAMPFERATISSDMERCRIELPLPEEFNLPLSELQCLVSDRATHTPVQIFNWASTVARRIRGKLRRGRLSADVWGYRTVTKPSACAPEPEEVAAHRRRERLILWVTGECGRSDAISFQLGDAHDLGQYTTVVPDFMQALHMIGMVLDALDASIVEVGSRGREMNEDVMAYPSAVWRAYGMMVRAGNFVMPLRSTGSDRDDEAESTQCT